MFGGRHKERLSNAAARSRARSFLAEEVIQSSSMDCGPATLKCFLAAYGVHVSYDRMREECQTDVDGTSIDTIGDAAGDLGVPSAQQILPPDAVWDLLPEVGPSICVTQLDQGYLHFVVLWRRLERWMQLMDPEIGRRWLSYDQLLRQFYIHSYRLPAHDWLELVNEGPYRPWLEVQIDRIGTKTSAKWFLDRAIRLHGWRGLSAADAAARFVHRARAARAVKRGSAAAAAFERCFELALSDLDRHDGNQLPSDFYFAYPAQPLEEEEEPQVTMRGVILLSPTSAPAEPDEAVSAAQEARMRARNARLEASEPSTWVELAKHLHREGWMAVFILLCGLVLSGSGALVEVVLFRSSFTLLSRLGLFKQRIALGGVIASFLFGLFLVECINNLLTNHIGRILETRLRVASLEKIPRLIDAYFRSRPISDMAQRLQSVERVRDIPALGQILVRSAIDLIVTLSAIIAINPSGAPIALLNGVLLLVLPLLTRRWQQEQDLRVQTQEGALSITYLDALRGQVPIRTHGAEQTMRVANEERLVKWSEASWQQLSTFVVISGLQAAAGVFVLVSLVFSYMRSGAGEAGLLLVLFWSQRLPSLASNLVDVSRSFLRISNTMARVNEPLRAAERPSLDGPPIPGGLEAAGGVEVRFEDVSVVAGGQPVLRKLSCRIKPGEHIAIVGRSGAGKSSLVGLLLGWHTPHSGRILVDGRELDEATLGSLRSQTAWVSPEVQLWDQSLLENIEYGAEGKLQRSTDEVVTSANLGRVLEQLPEGFQTGLGNNGSLLSGGEGQRVRLARALLPRQARLVILDEPFRGLDREQRRRLLQRVRDLWRGATLLCITHDVAETKGFNRVLVIHEGRLVEDEAPETLAARKSRYRTLIDADERANASSWNDRLWRKVRIDRGTTVEQDKQPEGE